MTRDPGGNASRSQTHWDGIYTRNDDSKVSWYQAEPSTSLALIDALGVGRGDGVIDVGGGSSRLVDALVARDFTDLTVLDVSSVALEVAQRRLGAQASDVSWIVNDLLSWRPERCYDLWHDRAVFHFLTDPIDRDQYVRVLHTALAPRGSVVIATFASDGPEQCSGLPVMRYDPDDLAGVFGHGFGVVESAREEHRTPNGSLQPFTWLALGRIP